MAAIGAMQKASLPETYGPFATADEFTEPDTGLAKLVMRKAIPTG